MEKLCCIEQKFPNPYGILCWDNYVEASYFEIHPGCSWEHVVLFRGVLVWFNSISREFMGYDDMMGIESIPWGYHGDITAIVGIWSWWDFIINLMGFDGDIVGSKKLQETGFVRTWWIFRMARLIWKIGQHEHLFWGVTYFQTHPYVSLFDVIVIIMNHHEFESDDVCDLVMCVNHLLGGITMTLWWNV